MSQNHHEDIYKLDPKEDLTPIKPILCHWCGTLEVTSTGAVCEECEKAEDYHEHVSKQTIKH